MNNIVNRGYVQRYRNLIGCFLTKKAFNEYFYSFSIVFVSLITFRVLLQMHAPHFEALSQAAYGVIEGKPHWIAYQNRLLGPIVVFLISKISFLTYSQSLKLFIFLTIYIENIVLFKLLVKMNTTYRRSFLWVVFFSATFVGFQDASWFYAWDSIDLIIFTICSWGIIQSQSMYLFTALFFVGILNRESALFISLYIILDSFYFNLKEFRILFVDKVKFATGTFLSFFGIIYTKLIRDYLFVSRTNGLDDKPNAVLGNHVYLKQNLLDLFLNNIINIKSLRIINSLFILSLISYLIYSFRAWTDAQIKAILIFLVIMTNILVFGLINETRLYFVLFPFLIFFKISIDKPSVKMP